MPGLFHAIVEDDAGLLVGERSSDNNGHNALFVTWCKLAAAADADPVLVFHRATGVCHA
jgi:hypothetical protein